MSTSRPNCVFCGKYISDKIINRDSYFKMLYLSFIGITKKYLHICDNCVANNNRKIE